MAIVFKQSLLTKLMVALGHKAAEKWSVTKLGSKVAEEVPNVDGDTAGKLDPKRKVTFDKVSKVLKDDAEWSIEESAPEAPTAPAKKPAKKADKVKSGKKKPKKNAEATSATIGGMERTNAGVGSGNGPKGKIGVKAAVLELLGKASKTKPLSMERVMEVLTKNFGPKSEHKRPLSGLYTTAYAQLNYQLKNYDGYDVKKTDERPAKFWLKSATPNKALIKK